MKKTALALFCAALMAGCASTSTTTAPAQSYRAKGSESAVTLTGSMTRDEHMTSTDHAIIIKINEQPVISGPIGNGAQDLTGEWDGKPVQALCNRSGTMSNTTSTILAVTGIAFADESDLYSITCRVIIAGEFAGTLSFH